MRGWSSVEVDVLQPDWFMRMRSSSRSTLSVAGGSDTIAFHMVTATLRDPRAVSRASPGPAAVLAGGGGGGVDETRWAPYLVQVGEHCSRLATVSLGRLLASTSRALSRL